MERNATIQTYPLEGKRLRLHYLDGLRGLAAFHVVLIHAFGLIADSKGWLADRWVDGTKWVSNGRFSVLIFIALSGYCLMLPVVRAGGLQGGVAGFVKRRSWRILPPYYAALALSLGVIVFVPGMGVPQGLDWDNVLPATSPGVVVAHLLLVQDFHPGWLFKIQVPMWTIAQEWQIYFVFALLLVPMWRRVGILATVVFTFVASVLLKRIFGHDFSYAAPVFLFLFGVGMFAAAVSFPASGWLLALRDRVPWIWPTALGWTVYLVFWFQYPDFKHYHSLPSALLAAGTIFSTLVFCTRSAQQKSTNYLLRLFEWEPVVVLGTFSYSLYLVHFPILGVVTLVMHRLQIPGPWAIAFALGVAVPLVLLIAYGFHVVFERPFMRGHPKSLPRAEKAAVLDPAP